MSLISGLIGVGAWLAYTCNVTGASGTITTVGTVTARYLNFIKWCLVYIDWTITTNGTGGTAVDATLPFTARTGFFIFVGVINSSGHIASGQVGFTSQTKVSIRRYDGTYPGADGARGFMLGIFEIA